MIARHPGTMVPLRRAAAVHAPAMHARHLLPSKPSVAGCISPCSIAGARPVRGALAVQAVAIVDEAPRPKVLPNKKVMDIWRNAEAVCFDVDCTITVNDSLDLLAEFMGVGPECADITNKAMNGTMGMEEALEERLNMINCTPADIKRFIRAHPPKTRITPGIVELINSLKARGVKVFLISGGFREMLLPLAKMLGIPPEQVFANRMLWQWDDETMMPTKLVGFDTSEPTSQNQGKPEAISRLREKFPYQSVVMIGDGITDLEAVQTTGGADLFIGYGGVIERETVKKEADWYIYDWADLAATLRRTKVAMIGSGAWASSVVSIMSQNTHSDSPVNLFEENISMWVRTQEAADAINSTHENAKYLPGISLGDNVVANCDLEECVRDADVLVFCCPHQFMRDLCKQLVGKVKPGAIAISLVKGMRVPSDGPQLMSTMVTRYLGVDCSVLMGANLAEGVAKKDFAEAVIGYNNLDNAKVLKKLISRPYFRINLLPDAAGAEMCGTLKNIVAIGAGLVDGLGYGPNSKAAIMREGLDEMRRFSKAVFPAIRDDTFLESCGMADLIATCYGGRNRRVAMEYAKCWLSGTPETFASLEKQLLNGQKLQGTLTSNEVQEIIDAKKWAETYPLFTTINRIINKELDPSYVVKYMEPGVATGRPMAAPSTPSRKAGAAKKYSPLTLTLDDDDSPN